MIRKAKGNQTPRNQRVSGSASLPAPTGGWNSRDSIAAMAPTDAVTLENWFPEASNVKIRKGAENWATGLNGRVLSLIPYISSTVKELYAVTGTSIYEVTTEGAVGASVATVTLGYCQSVNMTTSGGSFLIVVNGLDEMLQYDGTTWTSINGSSSPAITGVLTESIIHLNLFKKRLWLVEKETLSAWYLPTDSIAGAATEFPLGGVFSRGGYLMAMGTWTLDGGSGLDDLAVFVSSEGEVAVYQGTNPASDFALIGVYYVGAPIGRRCLEKMGGDLLYLCRQGLYPLSSALQSASIDRSKALSSKIDPSFNLAVETYGANLGWQTVIFPSAALLFVNIPKFVGTRSDQYAMNLITGSWCSFTGWLASCWAVFDNELYFGGEQIVAKAWTGTHDFDANITATCQQAYSYFGQMGAVKHFKLLRPMLTITNSFTLSIGLHIDFEPLVSIGSVAAGTVSSDTWDNGRWDTARWVADADVFKHWLSVSVNDGYAASLYLKVATKTASIGWNATDFVFQQGGIL